MGRHVWFGRRWEDRKDISTYLARSRTTKTIDTESVAMIAASPAATPARIEQVCSLALTYAHTGAAPFVWRDLIDAMVVIESAPRTTSNTAC
jgi:hypothetical protein